MFNDSITKEVTFEHGRVYTAFYIDLDPIFHFDAGLWIQIRNFCLDPNSENFKLDPE